MCPSDVTDAYPLSDQQNKGRWVRFEPMSDEFEGKELDLNKWTVGMKWWKGRQPAFFSDKNVTVSDGKLHLTMRKEKLPPETRKARLPRLHLGGLAHQGPLLVRLLRGEGQADELRRVEFLLVPAGRHAGRDHGNRRVRDRRQCQGLRAQVQHDPARHSNRPTSRSHWQVGDMLVRPLAIGRRLSRLRTGLGQGRDAVLRRRRASSARWRTRTGISRST